MVVPYSAFSSFTGVFRITCEKYKGKKENYYKLNTPFAKFIVRKIKLICDMDGSLIGTEFKMYFLL